MDADGDEASGGGDIRGVQIVGGCKHAAGGLRFLSYSVIK